MRKKVIKISFLLLIFAIIIIAIPTRNVYARERYFRINEDRNNGLFLGAGALIDGCTESFIDFGLLELPSEKILNGISAELAMSGGTPISIRISDSSTYWQVTSYYITNNKISFLIELEDSVLESGNPPESLPCVTIRYEKESQNISASMDKDKLILSYENNENVKPLENDFYINPIKGIYNPVWATDESKANNSVKVDGNNIYARLDSDSNTGVVQLMTLFDMIGIDDSMRYYELNTDSFGVNGKSGGRADFTDNTWRNSLYGFGNAYKLKIDSDYGRNEYNVYQMGNTYLNPDDKNHTNLDVIDINDVLYFRKAVVGINEVLDNPNFCVEATDVNFSNDNLGELGDIGDIISIRRRILNKRWSSMPLTPIILDGTYSDGYEPSGGFIFYSDGTVRTFSNVLGGIISYDTGTYLRTGKDIIELHFNKNHYQEVTMENEEITDIDVYIEVKYINENTLYREEYDGISNMTYDLTYIKEQ